MFQYKKLDILSYSTGTWRTNKDWRIKAFALQS